MRCQRMHISSLANGWCICPNFIQSSDETIHCLEHSTNRSLRSSVYLETHWLLECLREWSELLSTSSVAFLEAEKEDRSWAQRWRVLPDRVERRSAERWETIARSRRCRRSRIFPCLISEATFPPIDTNVVLPRACRLKATRLIW